MWTALALVQQAIGVILQKSSIAQNVIHIGGFRSAGYQSETKYESDAQNGATPHFGEQIWMQFAVNSRISFVYIPSANSAVWTLLSTIRDRQDELIDYRINLHADLLENAIRIGSKWPYKLVGHSNDLINVFGRIIKFPRRTCRKYGFCLTFSVGIYSSINNAAHYY